MIVAAEVAVSLLMIVVHAEAQSLSCTSSCVAGSTAENDPIEFKCQVDDPNGRAVLKFGYLDNKSWQEFQGVYQQVHRGSITTRDFSGKAPAPNVAPLICSVTGVNVALPTCEIEKCDVLYSVRNTATWPLLTVSPGEEITCMAEGNPKPTFRWQRMNSAGKWMDLPDENSEKIDAELVDGESVDLRCVAENTFRGEKHIKPSSEINVSKHGKIIRIAVIVSSCVGALLLIIILAILYHKYPDFFNKAIQCSDD